MGGELRKARGATGTIDVVDPAQDGRVVARALWFGDPWKGDWEWQIRPEDPALRKRLDECYTQNEGRFRGVDFGQFSNRRSPAWTSFEGTVGALYLALPGIRLDVGAVEFPEAVPADAGDVTFDLYEAGAAATAEAERQLVREQRERLWAAAGETPPEVSAEDAAEDVGVAAVDAALGEPLAEGQTGV